MKFPTLYNASSSAKFKVWTIEAFEDRYEVTHGFEGCKMQTQVRPVEEKNIGKANHTTKPEQAILEAQAKWQKQIDKKGYRESKSDIGVNDYIHPMKAGYFNDNIDKIQFPCYIQPKLNGVKVIAPERIDGIVKYQSSGGKYYTTISHLDNEIKFIFDNDFIIDGECYIHGIDLQDISSAVKKYNELSPQLEYWIYDIVDIDTDYENRFKIIEESFKSVPNNGDFKIKICPTHEVNSHEEIRVWNKYYVGLGYEGIIVRNKNGGYKFGPNRCQNCLKLKDFQDAEFEIVEALHDIMGRVIWICKADNGNLFKVVPKGSIEYRQRLFKDKEKYFGKKLTVRFLEYSKDGVPQGNPVGHGNPKNTDIIGECIRDYE